jgi:hypothetical protein
MTKLLSSLFVIVSLGVTPSLASNSTRMNCVEYFEIRDLIIETEWFSPEEKDQLLRNLESFHGLSCLWPSFIP